MNLRHKPLAKGASTLIGKFGIVSLFLVVMACLIIWPSEPITAQPLMPDESSISSPMPMMKAPATLSIANDLSATAGSSIEVPVMLASNDNQIVSAGFDLGFDSRALSFDPTDSDEDGIPDAISFDVPDGLLTLASFDQESHLLKVVISDLSLPFSVLADGAIMTVSLQVNQSASACNPSAAITLTDSSLGNTEGQSVDVITSNGEVMLSSECKIYLPVTTR